MTTISAESCQKKDDGKDIIGLLRCFQMVVTARVVMRLFLLDKKPIYLNIIRTKSQPSGC